MLFGHQNDDVIQPASAPAAPASDPDTTALNPLAVDPATGVSLPTAPEADSAPDLDQPAISTASAPVIEPDGSASFNPSDSASSILSDSDRPAAILDTDTPSVAAAPATDDLLAMKQQAIAQLSPLVDQLDQTPEEKFRTTMMLIQSTDNQALLKDAYEAAQAISDEKAKAQALLDVVNEINYFTQQKS